MEDKEFQKLVKKSRNKQRKKLIGLYIVTLIIFVGAGISLMYDYNYGPFQGDKIAGVRDNSIKSVRADAAGVAALLFQQSGEFRFNVEAEEFTLYLDYYQKDELIKSDVVFGVSNDERFGIYGNLLLGITSGDSKLLTRYNGGTYGGVYSSGVPITLSDYQESELSINASFLVPYDNSQKIQLGEEYILYFANSSGGFYEDVNQNLTPEALRQTDETIVVYMIFE